MKKNGRHRGISAPAAPPAAHEDPAQAQYRADLREYRRFLEQCETEATSDFDKTTVSLSGGALAIALAFLEEVPTATPKWAIWILAGAMLGLVVSLIGVLLSLMAARKSMRYELQCLDKKREKPDGEQAGGKWRSATETFNWTALVSCVVGIGALATFFVITIIWRDPMANERTVPTPSTNNFPRPVREGEIIERGRTTPDRPAPPPPAPAANSQPDKKD